MKKHPTHSRFSSALTALLLVTACSEPSADTESRTISALNSDASAEAVRGYAEVAGPVLLTDQTRPAALANCDPLAQNCPTGEMCVIAFFSFDEFECIPDVHPDEGRAFAPCDYSDACAPSFFCMVPAVSPECDPEEIGCCVPVCDLEAPDCPEDHTCEPWFIPEEAPPGLEHIGVCANF
ncbi:hypothetical protein OV090_11970 [Nannocystis sp. RBIL2]|uniref:hypothetical protein n=1 Tax=Nannocystis sp. RBIL2 TaxID=2996788 RepID=UPI00226FC124|nr:hypothetical protein [Nannocystis sp. RBIL2]MCY1065486.1 hypothetical protein [Nannocystis sp. RBIL2]